MGGWSLWGWLVFSLLLQLITAGAERIAAGTTAVRRLRTVADVLSIPLVRKAVHASLAGGIVVRVVVAGVPAAASLSGLWAASEEPADNIPVGSVVYTVQPGDNLARIAKRFYADGDKWQV